MSVALRTVPTAEPIPEPPWTLRQNGDVITLKFRGELSAAEGQRSVERLVEHLKQRPAHVLLDVREMQGYDRAARRAWIFELRPVRGQIRSMTCRGGTLLIRAGARTMGLALGIQVVCE